MKGLFETHVGLVGKVMGMQLQRQNVVMSNVANVRTPGYRTRHLEFEDKLQTALALNDRGNIARTHNRHMPAFFNPEGFSPEMEKALTPHYIYGEDRVDLDKEMAVMAKTSLQYSALTTVMKSSFEGLRNIIQEGQK
jgi:flagellar basal-body rod protein FlgB